MKLALPISLLTLLAGSAFGNVIVNGDFQTGDLAGWTVFTTGANGSTGAGLPDVTTFDTGSGPSLAAQFDVGEITNDATQQGGGLFQNLILSAGTYSFSAALGVQDSPLGPNGEDGVFSVLLDGVQQGIRDEGISPGANAIVIDTLTATLSISTPGSHEIRILITRPFDNGIGTTPEQYLDNITLTDTSASGVPEPTSFALVGGALAALAALRRRLA